MDTTQNKLFGKTFFLMFLGLLGSAIVAWYTYYSGLFLDIVLQGGFSVLLILELVAVLLFSFLFRKLPPVVVGILYFVYWLILALFCGVTIYDINKIKMLQNVPDIDQEKIYIYCAMQLYLDFINIFLRILSIFGKRKN